MENEIETCSVCSMPYDTKDHTPRVLINCGHTLCSSCLIKILKSPQLRKCPFDNLSFKRTQKCLANFPVNFALSALLEEKNRNVCKDHGEKLLMFCLRDKVKICYGCALFGGHKGHAMKMISDLKVQGMKKKKYLEECFMRFEENQLEKDQKMSLLKEDFLIKMGDKFEDIKVLLKMKELEWTKEIDSLFSKNGNRFLLKNEVEETIEEISQACKEEDNNLSVLDQSFSSMISRLEEEEAFELSEETSRAMDCIEYFLVNQEKSLKNFDFLDDEIESEEFTIEKEESEQEQSPFRNRLEAIQKTSITSIWGTQTRVSLMKVGEILFIDNRNSTSMNSMINFDSVKRVRIELEKYDSLFSNLSELNFVSETLQQLNNCTSLEVIFAPLGLNDNSVLILFNRLFCRIQQFTNLEITFGYDSFGEEKITNETIKVFCTAFLPKAACLRNLTLRLGSSLVDDRSLFALAGSLFLLESFTLGVGNTAITDKGIEQVLNAILRVKVLDLDLKGTLVTDKSLKVLGDNMMMNLRNLENFSLNLCETKITIEGVRAIFEGIPIGIRSLNLDFSRVALPDEVAFLFEETVCPKLGLVEEVYLRLEGRYGALKTSKILDSVRKKAAKRRRAALHK